MPKSSKKPSTPKLPSSLTAKQRGNIAILRLSRPHKRNALDDTTILGIESFFKALPKETKAVVIHGAGEHFSAGLDLGELTERDVAEGVQHSRMWHRVFDTIQFGKVPVVAVLHGAVVGGGLELAAACHLRVAERRLLCAQAAAVFLAAAAGALRLIGVCG
jgi:enoyl-CoA hydratase/carnithine racemase